MIKPPFISLLQVDNHLSLFFNKLINIKLVEVDVDYARLSEQMLSALPILLCLLFSHPLHVLNDACECHLCQALLHLSEGLSLENE